MLDPGHGTRKCGGCRQTDFPRLSWRRNRGSRLKHLGFPRQPLELKKNFKRTEGSPAAYNHRCKHTQFLSQTVKCSPFSSFTHQCFGMRTSCPTGTLKVLERPMLPVVTRVVSCLYLGYLVRIRPTNRTWTPISFMRVQRVSVHQELCPFWNDGVICSVQWHWWRHIACAWQLSNQRDKTSLSDELGMRTGSSNLVRQRYKVKF